MARSVVGGAVGGFGPFDEAHPVGLTEYGGGSGLVEGSPTSQSFKSGKRGEGRDHTAGQGAAMTVDEKIGVAYRTKPGRYGVPDGAVDPVTGLSVDDVN